jgi:two-component system phosphate regulon response regulator OmpR
MAAAPARPQSAPSADPDSLRHILVVDDDKRIRDLLQRYLSENGYHVTTAGTAAEARDRTQSFTFDMMVVDVMMPGESGTDFVRALRRTADTPVLLLTARGEAEHRIAGLEAGADDYLAKPFEPRELLLRIAAILRRAPAAAMPEGDTLSMGACSFDSRRGELLRDGAPVRLTTGELALLRLFAGSLGKTLSRYDIADRTGVNERSVDVQITRLRRKIEPDPRSPRYLQTVWGEGYILVPD